MEDAECFWWWWWWLGAWGGWGVTELDWQLDDRAKGQEWPSRDLKRTIFNQKVFYQFISMEVEGKESFPITFLQSLWRLPSLSFVKDHRAVCIHKWISNIDVAWVAFDDFSPQFLKSLSGQWLHVLDFFLHLWVLGDGWVVVEMKRIRGSGQDGGGAAIGSC